MNHPPATDRMAWRLKVVRLAIPIMLANLTVPLVGAVDTAVMGRMSDPAFIGATAIGATIFSSIFWLFGFLRMGTGGLVAQQNGSGDNAEVRDTVYRALLIGLFIGLLIIALQGPIFAVSHYAFTASDQLIALTRDYYNIRIYSAPATLMQYSIIGALVGLQKMKSVLLVQLLLNLANIALTLYFFAVLEWGIKGVALASVLSDYAALIVGLCLLRQQASQTGREFQSTAIFSRTRVQELISINGNLLVRTLCLIIAFYWVTAASSRLGELTLAANTVLLQMLHLLAYGLDGFSHAAESLCGQAFGARNRERFVIVVRTCSEWGLLFALLFTAVFWFAGIHLIGVMTTMESVIHTASYYLPWIVMAPVLSIWGFLLDGIYIGVTHAREMRNGMLISLLVFAISSLVFIPLFGNHGLWAAYLVLMLCRALTLGFWFPRILKHFEE